MATLTTQFINRGTSSVGGTSIAPVAATGTGDAMTCGAQSMLWVVNAGASSSTITMNVPDTRVFESGVAIVDPAFSVQSGQTRVWGPVDAVTFMDPTTGLASVTYSQGTISVAAVNLVQP